MDVLTIIILVKYFEFAGQLRRYDLFLSPASFEKIVGDFSVLFSLGWNIAAEDFFSVNENIINQLKPRVSWGTLGNQKY